MELTNRLREIRFQHLLTNQEIAQITGNTLPTVCNWFASSNKMQPTETQINTVISWTKKNTSRRSRWQKDSPNSCFKLHHLMKVHRLTRDMVAEALQVDPETVRRWASSMYEEKPTDEQLTILRSHYENKKIRLCESA